MTTQKDLSYLDGINYFFCPKCGGKLIQKKHNLLKCTKCGFDWYQNPIPSNAAILENEKGEILIIKRRWPPKQGYYDLPGGFVDIEENLDKSVKRELKEEIDGEISDLEFFLGSEPDRYLFQGVNYHTLCFIYTGKVKGGSVKALDDVGEIEFVKKDKIPFGKFAFKSIDEALSRYLKKYNLGGYLR